MVVTLSDLTALAGWVMGLLIDLVATLADLAAKPISDLVTRQFADLAAKLLMDLVARQLVGSVAKLHSYLVARHLADLGAKRLTDLAARRVVAKGKVASQFSGLATG
ncbi:uncharacterized protein KRP23_6926 [Phytophthora ramorum]|uniref:uncharacterized protein n=1 Tax=Phytophthora ramorum TaxID=164328 RepID=UPI0030A8404F|nr:hypothetical protein KRP23_6926 [Phytophthora ramorum]